MITELNNETFEQEVLKETKTVLVDFYANWCGPCKMVRPILEEIARENDTYKIASINVDDFEELASHYRVSSIPCMILFQNGNEVDRIIGLHSKEDILSALGGK